MSQEFNHSAETLWGFFSVPGRGFYVPYYQRNYSWGKDQAEKLATDIFSGVRRTITKPNNSVFLGTVILHEEKQVKVGNHTDVPNILTKVHNVVDGQQRITSIALFACALLSQVNKMATQLCTINGETDYLKILQEELNNQKPELEEFFSIEVKKTGAEPPRKPVIIRAGDVNANPVSDQWTLNGKPSSYYRSNTSQFLSDYILGNQLEDIRKEKKIEQVLSTFEDVIKSELQDVDQVFVRDLISCSLRDNNSLYNFISYPPDMQELDILNDYDREVVLSSIVLLAACSFFKNSCNFVVIECLDLELAFDMFQSLNATGTPLTAFEVFKPKLVKDYQQRYTSTVKHYVDRIERVFDLETRPGDKQDLTAKVLVASALNYSGEAVGKRFSDIRDWLLSNQPGPDDDLAIPFIRCIADQADYHASFVKPNKPSKGSNKFKLVTELERFGVPKSESDITALCIYYLKDANHQFAHSVISLFFSKLLAASDDRDNLAAASDEFVKVVKATAAFFTLWMGAVHSKFPDSEYRLLFDQKSRNISVKFGSENQSVDFVIKHFRQALTRKGVFDTESADKSKKLWVSLAKNNTWYTRKAVCRFALFVASHDAAPSIAPGEEGLIVDGKSDSYPMLTCKKWYSREYEVIEHIATRDRPKSIKFENYFDSSIYPGNYSIVDRLGNLTLLSNRVNASIYSEWPDKVFYYWSLTSPNQAAKSPSAAELKEKLLIQKLPPQLASLSSNSSYLAPIAPLAYRGSEGLAFDKDFIDLRSENLCTRVYDKLLTWLQA